MPGTYREREAGCEAAFGSLGSVFHACTPENHEIIFTCDADFCAAMSILAICSRLFPDVRILTFQLLGNHVHLVLCACEQDALAFFDSFNQRLHKYFESIGRFVNLTKFQVRLFPVDSLEYVRAAIAYVNRNCFIISEDITPFSYPWGAGSCYFNNAMLQLYNNCRQPLKVVQIRQLFHSKIADNIKPLFLLGSHVSPLSFCDIKTGESLFRSERHYFYSIAKNVETYKQIADSIGEYVYYTDEDLYQVVTAMVHAKYGDMKPSLVAPDAKIEMAKVLLQEYHAGKKQIMRMLKIDSSIMDSLLPTVNSHTTGLYQP